MKMPLSVESSGHQRLLKLILGVSAFIAASLGLSSYIHELGHVFFAYLVGGSGRIVNTNLSQISVQNGFQDYVATMGGVWFESAFWLILYRLSWNKAWRSIPIMFAIAAPFYGLIASILGLEFGGYAIPDNVRVGSFLFFLSSFLWWGIWFWLLFRKVIQSTLRRTSIYYQKGRKNNKYESPLAGK